VVALKRDGQGIVAVGAIKQTRPKYAASIAKKSGFAFDPNIHELGYVAVKETQRGKHLSHHITSALLSRFDAHPLFAMTSNPRMKSTLKRFGFVQQGKEWLGHGEHSLSLWLKDADATK